MPRVFISYSWTSPDHEDWVLTLATSLRESGVDIVLDKWDLKEGHDALQFMEQMVTDTNIEKVILVIDQKYAEKSDSRSGGVGTEAQIISPELYGRRDQNKFVAVVRELDGDAKPILPTYYKSRIYIDFSDQETFYEKFEQLTRWVFDKPFHQKPALGKVPSFVTDSQNVSIPVNSKAKRVMEAIRAGQSNALSLTQEYLEELSENFEAFRIDGGNIPEFDDKILKSLEDFHPYERQFLDLIRVFARYQKEEDAARVIHRFFESLIQYLFRPSSISSYTKIDFDNYKIIVHRLFLFSIAALLKQERFDILRGLTGSPYYVGNVDEFSNTVSLRFDVFRQSTQSLENRNNRLKLRRSSLQADFLIEAAKSNGFADFDVLQADFFLYLTTEFISKDRYSRWYPVSLPYMDRQNKPFEVFARATSREYFNKLAPALGGTNIGSFKSVMDEFNNGTRKPPNSDGWYSLNPPALANAEKIGSEA